jgi:hypothetical protein
MAAFNPASCHRGRRGAVGDDLLQSATGTSEGLAGERFIHRDPLTAFRCSTMEFNLHSGLHQPPVDEVAIRRKINSNVAPVNMKRQQPSRTRDIVRGESGTHSVKFPRQLHGWGAFIQISAP